MSWVSQSGATCTATKDAALSHGAATAFYQSGDPLGTLPAQVFTWSPTVDLTPGFVETIVGGSVRLALGGKLLVDRNGRMDMDVDHATGAGTQAGTLDYTSGTIALTAWTPGATNSGTALAMLTSMGGLGGNEVTFRTASAPLRPASLILQFQFQDASEIVTVTATTDGLLTAQDVDGRVDYQTGIVRVGFGTWVTVTPEVEAQPWYFPEAVVNGMAFKPRPVLADTIRYAAVAYSYIPLDKDILGVDPVRLPSDGRVPIFRVGDVAVVHHTDHASIASLTVPQTINLGRTRLSRVWLFDEGNANARVPTTHYTTDLDAGTVTLTSATGLVGPIRIEHRIEDMALISDAQINGQLTFTRPLTHDYPALTTGVSSALVIGDMQARATKPFDQMAWTGEWSDGLIGNPTTAEYNSTTYPVVVDNIGAIQERWALIFTSPTEVRVVGESVGQIATLPIAAEIAPINPNTNQPYFRLSELGWGGGWAAGNVLRFNTIAANYPVWIARTIQQGPASGDSDGFRIQIRGDADAT